jgi:preprotein translocase subunit YajC
MFFASAGLPSLVLAQGQGGGPIPFYWVLGGILVLFYFMMIRPQRKQKIDREQMLSALKKNDRVVTVGGLFGTIVNVQNEGGRVTIRVDESTNTKIVVMRDSILRVVNDDDGDDKKAE